MTGEDLFYFHHAGGLPVAPRGLREAGSQCGVARTVAIAFESKPGSGGTIEMLASCALSLMPPDAFSSGAALYGHSMGGLIVFEMCRQLAAAGRRLPDAVLLGATAPPGALPETALVLEGLGIASPSATSRTAQRVEAGVARARRYRPAPMALPIDLHVAYGTHDPLVTEEVVAGWQGQGARRLHLHRIEGDHLFHQTTGGRLGEVLGLALLRLT